MPPGAGLAIAGVPWPIIQRGNNRSACFTLKTITAFISIRSWNRGYAGGVRYTPTC